MNISCRKGWATCKRESGTPAVVCMSIFGSSRHRWANVDYVLASAVSGSGVKKIKNSYDVGCEHEKGFFDRAEELPDAIKLTVPKDGWVFVVPKFHISAHKEACQAIFSPNYTPHMARFDGEGVERNWPKLSGGAASTKEMSPGGRWETLDDFCSFANWKKVVQSGAFLSRLFFSTLV